MKMLLHKGGHFSLGRSQELSQNKFNMLMGKKSTEINHKSVNFRKGLQS